MRFQSHIALNRISVGFTPCPFSEVLIFLYNISYHEAMCLKQG